MNLLADESVDWEIVEKLRTEGFSTIYIAELSPSIRDDEVLQEANSRAAILITADKDFGELVYRHTRVHAGVILIRLAGLSLAAKAETVARAIRDHVSEMQGAFSVISPGAVRIRRSEISGPED